MIETRIERVPANAYLGNRLSELKALTKTGWTVAALEARDGTRTVVLLACRDSEPHPGCERRGGVCDCYERPCALDRRAKCSSSASP